MLNHQIKQLNILRNEYSEKLLKTPCDNFVHNSVENHKRAFYLGLSHKDKVFELLKIDKVQKALLAKSKGIPKVEWRWKRY